MDPAIHETHKLTRDIYNQFTHEEALAALRQFRSEWESYHRLPITENMVMRGDALADEHKLNKTWR